MGIEKCKSRGFACVLKLLTWFYDALQYLPRIQTKTATTTEAWTRFELICLPVVDNHTNYPEISLLPDGTRSTVIKRTKLSLQAIVFRK